MLELYGKYNLVLVLPLISLLIDQTEILMQLSQTTNPVGWFAYPVV